MVDDLKSPTKELEHGNIVFQTPAGNLLELRGDGAILVRGEVAEDAPAVVGAFRAWLTAARVYPYGNAKVKPAESGNITLASGRGLGAARGGNVTFFSESALAELADALETARRASDREWPAIRDRVLKAFGKSGQE